MLADAEFFNSRISKVGGAGDLGQHLVNIIDAKPIITEPFSRSSAESQPKQQVQESNTSNGSLEGGTA